MKIFWILIERFSYTARTSLGKMYFVYQKEFVTNPPEDYKEYFGFTLEDTARPDNIKVYGETCLPGGLECLVSLYDSPHFGKTIIFHTETDGVTILFNNLSWEYSLAHGGNTHRDTEGCVLVAKNQLSRDMIQGSLKDDLRKVIEQRIKDGWTIKAKFINLSQLN